MKVDPGGGRLRACAIFRKVVMSDTHKDGNVWRETLFLSNQ